jgi:hypothetical protein
LSSGEKRAGCADLVTWPWATFFRVYWRTPFSSVVYMRCILALIRPKEVLIFSGVFFLSVLILFPVWNWRRRSGLSATGRKSSRLRLGSFVVAEILSQKKSWVTCTYR